jgi:hypothetical protein
MTMLDSGPDGGGSVWLEPGEAGAAWPGLCGGSAGLLFGLRR